MASRKKTAYTRAFGGGTDNLWETVDTIMVDLMTQQMNGDGHSLSEDVDEEKSKSNSKKDAELNEMMENLDHVLDDLRDISSISNDNATPPKPIQTSAERIRTRRTTNKEFLGKENPFDPITQGLLYQTADIPLFASSSITQSSDDEVQEADASVFFAGEQAWDEDEYESHPKGSSDQENVGSTISANGSYSTPEGHSRLYEASKAQETRKNIKDRINIFQELSKNTPPVTEQKSKDRPTPVVHHNIISPTTSFRSRPFSSSASGQNIRGSSNSSQRADLSSSISPSSSYSSSSSSSSSSLSSSISTTPTPATTIAAPATSSGSPRVSRAPQRISIPSSPKGSPQPSPTNASPSTPPSFSSSLGTSPAPSYRPPVPPRSVPGVKKRTNISSSVPSPAPQFMPVSDDDTSPTSISIPPVNAFSELNLAPVSSSAPNRERLNTRLNLILTTELPPSTDASILDRPKKHKKTLPDSQPQVSFYPSIRASETSARSQINIGNTRAIRVSADSNCSTSPISSEISLASTSPDSSTIPEQSSNSHVSSPPIPIPRTSDSDSSNSPSSPQSDLDNHSQSGGSEQFAATTPPSTSPLPPPSPSTTNPTVTQLREASMRRVLSSPHLRGRNNPPMQRVSSQNTIIKKNNGRVPPSTSPPSLSSSYDGTPPSSSPPPSAFGAKPKSLRSTPVGQHRTTSSRLIFGGEGMSIHMPTSGSAPAPGSAPRPSSGGSVPVNGQTPPETCTNNTPNTNNTSNTTNTTPTNPQPTTFSDNEGITRRAPASEVKERNAKIKQLRDLTRRYRAKLGQMDTKYTRECQELQSQLAIALKEAAMHVKTCSSWGHHVLTKACRQNWQLKVIVLQHRLEMRTTQTNLLLTKIEIVEQLMHLLEIEYRQGSDASAKNDFVIYSSFFKDPTEVMTNADVERITRVLPELMREKRKAKVELSRVRITYQPEQLERRIRRVKDILVRMLPSPLIQNYYLIDDILQADFDSLVTDQRLLEGRHIQHLRTFLQDDLAGERSITPNEVTDFLEQFAFKMSETFGVAQQDFGRLLLLCKRAIYPRIYPLLAVPASVYEEDKKLTEQLTWLNKLDPVVLREGLKLDNRPFQNPNSIAAFEPAIEALNELAFVTIPTEMAVAVHKCFKLTHDITHAQIKSSGGPSHSEMGLDDVFPVFLWIVTQCHVADLCKCVYFMEFYSDSDEKISALGYSATSLAAAVAHLGMIEKESFLPPVVP